MAFCDRYIFNCPPSRPVDIKIGFILAKLVANAIFNDLIIQVRMRRNFLNKP